MSICVNNTVPKFELCKTFRCHHMKCSDNLHRVFLNDVRDSFSQLHALSFKSNTTYFYHALLTKELTLEDGTNLSSCITLTMTSFDDILSDSI